MSQYGGGYSTNPSAPSAPPWQQTSSTGGQYGNAPQQTSSTGGQYGSAPQQTSSTGGQYGNAPPYVQPPSSSPYAHPSQSPWGQQNPSYSSTQQNPSYSSTPAGAPGYGGYPPYGYSPYGASHTQSTFPPDTDPEIVRAFQSADRDNSGQIDEQELQRTLSSTQPFNLRTVRLMIHLFGSKESKKIGPKEFATLWKALKEWKVIFQRFDRDRSGSIDKGEMREALMSLGYAVSPPILDCLLQKYDRTGQAKAMDYDSFVECGLIVKGLTEKFKEKDTQLRGSATLDYQTFMLMVLPFVVA